jgi:hypothetical protein
MPCRNRLFEATTAIPGGTRLLKPFLYLQGTAARGARGTCWEQGGNVCDQFVFWAQVQ